MKRFFALFVVLIFMVSAMCIPVFAAGLYQLEGHPEMNGSVYFWDFYLDYLEFGYYDIDLYNSENELIASSVSPWHYSSPFDFVYVPVVQTLFNGQSVDDRYEICIAGGSDHLVEVSNPVHSFADDPFARKLTIVFKPVSGSSSPVGLSSVVTSDMLSGALGQIVALLPAAVVCIVAFVGIRKGISFLQQIMHSA